MTLLAAIVLFASFFLDWFGVDAELTGSVLNGTANVSQRGISGWDALTDLPGFLIMLAGAAGVALAAQVATDRRVNLGSAPRGVGAFGLGALAVGLIGWRMAAGSPDLRVGVYVGLGAAAAITIGSYLVLRAAGVQVLRTDGNVPNRGVLASDPSGTREPGGDEEFCDSCGAPMLGGARFCRRCGAQA